MSKQVKKIPGERCEGCGYEPQGDIFHNQEHDLYVCEGCNEQLPDKAGQNDKDLIPSQDRD